MDAYEKEYYIVKVYFAMNSLEYECDYLLGVFASREQAVQFCRQHHLFGKYTNVSSFGVVEAELGQPIDDIHSMIELVE